MTLAIVTYLWRDPTRDNRGYICQPEHVRILKSMVERNTSVPHRFICVTDEEIEGIDCVPMNWEKHVPGTVYARLMQHNPEWARENLGDRVLSLDVDVAVTGSLDSILSREEDFIIWRNPNFPKPQRAFYQSSVQLFTPGARPQLFFDFDPRVTPRWVNWRFGGREQAWISERLDWDEAYLSDCDGVYGAGRLGGAGIGTDLPDNACIVSFPGSRAPWQPEVQEKHLWLKEHYR